MVLLGLIGIASAACPQLDARIAQVERQVKAVQTRDAEYSLLSAEVALGCGSPADPRQLARLWVLDGVLATITGDDNRATDAFTAAARTAPEVFEDVWGPKVKQAWDDALVAPTDPAELLLTPDLGGNIAFLDGVAAPDLSDTTAGLHAIQVTTPDRAVKFGRFVFLGPDQQLQIDTGVQTAPYVIDVVDPRAGSGLKKTGFLVAAGGAFVSSGALAFAADRQNRAIRGAQSKSSLDGAITGQYALATGAYTLLGTGLIMTAYWVLKQR